MMQVLNQQLLSLSDFFFFLHQSYVFDDSDKKEKTDDVPAKQASGSKPVCVLIFVSFCGQTLSFNQFCEDILAGSPDFKGLMEGFMVMVRSRLDLG